LVFQTCDTQGNCTPLSSLSVSLTTVPEPASIALIGTGLVAMAVGRKKLKANRAAA
jgi:PEP-CTERM motif